VTALTVSVEEIAPALNYGAIVISGDRWASDSEYEETTRVHLDPHPVGVEGIGGAPGTTSACWRSWGSRSLPGHGRITF